MFALSLPYPDAGRTGQVYGIEVAVRTFTHAWCRYTQQEKLYVLPEKAGVYELFRDFAATEGIDPDRCVNLSGENYHLINTIHTVFQPDPMILNMAWMRSMLQPGFAVCGLAHTMTGVSAANVVANYVSYPTQAGDAIICPSHAIKDVIEQHFRLSEEYFNNRFGLAGANAFKCPVDTPIIPLGIDTAHFAAKRTPEKRKAQRDALGIADDEVVILFFGRLSYFSKSHPLPLLLGADRAAEQLKGKQKLRLVLMGYFSPVEIEQSYMDLVRDMCPNIQVDIVKRDDPRFPDDLWAAADIFTSLVDNYQESFGLTPIEAMATGLPCVITNWDGYRDGVRHGQEGFQIPTAAPPPGAGLELAYRYFHSGDNYGEYLASTAQSVAVDIDMLTASFVLLATDANKRAAMGAMGAKRANATYDWKVIIPQYEALWKDQAQKRATFAKSAVPEKWNAIHTGYPDPYTAFQSFPSRHLKWEDIITLAADAATIEKTLAHPMNKFLPAVLMPFEKIIAILVWLGQQPNGASLQQIAAGSPEPIPAGTFFRTIGWMAKNGFVRIR